MSKYNGGPAFPYVHDIAPEPEFERCINVEMGMTLRDYFAAKALGGLLADIPNSMYGFDWESNVAQCSYRLADAMLKERAK